MFFARTGAQLVKKIESINLKACVVIIYSDNNLTPLRERFFDIWKFMCTVIREFGEKSQRRANSSGLRAGRRAGRQVKSNSSHN